MSLWRNPTVSLKSVSSSQPKSKKRARALKWACEPLEFRWLMATDSWITQGNGAWTTAANWSLGRVPIASDTVQIDVPGLNVTVTYNGSSQLSLNNLINDETLDIQGGGASWTGGVWDGAGVVQTDAPLALSGTDKVMRDGITLFNNSTVTMSGTGNIVGQVGATIDNEGTFNIESDADITFPTGVGEGIFNNGGLLEKTGGGTAAGDMTEIGGAQGFTYNNSDNFNFPLPAPGVTKVLVGTLDLGDDQNASDTKGGAFQVSAGATLEYDRGVENIEPFLLPDGVWVEPSFTGQGTLLISGGTVQHFGNFQMHEIDMENGTFLLQQNMAALGATSQLDYNPLMNIGTCDILILNGGNIGGNGAGIFPNPFPPTVNLEMPDLVVGNTFTWTGGSFTGTGRTVIDQTCTNATISTTNGKEILGDYGLDLYDEVVWTGSGTIDIMNNSVLWIHPSGTLWDQGNGTITGNGDTGNVWNSGNFLKEDGTGDTTIDTGITFLNDSAFPGRDPDVPKLDYNNSTSSLVAQLDIRTGTVVFNGNLTNSDTVLVHPGAFLNLAAGVDINGTTDSLNAPAKMEGVDGGGEIDFGADTFTGDTRALLDVPNATFGTGTYDFNNEAGGAQLVTTASFNGGVIGGTGTLEIGIDPNNPPVPLVPASFVWNSGVFTGSGVATSSLLIDPSAVLTIPSGDRFTSADYSIDNRGTIQWTTSPGLLTVDGNFDQTSTGIFDCVIAAGTPALDSLSVTGTITLDGTLNLTDETPPLDTEVFTLISNQGTVPATGIFIGLPEGTQITIGAAVYTISYVGNSDGLDVTLTAEVLPTVTIETPAAIVEPTTGTADLIFLVDLSQPVDHVVTVDYTTSDLTATGGVDYVTTSGTLSIPAETSQDSITVQIIGSTAVKPTETFTMTLSDPTGSLLGTPSSAIGTILNENGPPIFTFSSPTYSVQDDLGEATITVDRVNSPTQSCSVDYATSAGTAVPGVNYTDISGTLDFAANVNALTIEVPVINDEVFDGNATSDGDLTFNVALSNPQGDNATLGTPSTAVVTVVETTLPTINVSNASVAIPDTGTANLIFTVTVQANPNTVSVNYTTADGTALAGTDYTAASGTLSFAAGETSQTVTVAVLPNTAVTANKTMTLTLSNAVNGGIVVDSGTGTLINYNIPVVSIANTTVTEPLGGLTNAVFTVSLNTAPFTPLTVNYITSDGTGVAGTDYVAESGTVSFAVGQTSAVVDVPIYTTFSTAAGSNFNVTLSSPVETTLGTSTATGSIVNLPVNTVTFSAGHAFHYIGAAGNHVTLSLAGPGIGTLNYLGLQIDDAKEVILNGTSVASTFRIATSKPRAFLINLDVEGSIKAIIAPTMSLQNDLTVTGDIQRLQLNQLLGSNTLNIAGAATDFPALTASFAAVSSANFTSAMPLASLRVASAVGFNVSAPAVTSLISAGNFTGNVSLTGSLGALRVGRVLSNSDINVAGNIGLVAAATVTNSTIFAGVDSGVVTLPSATSQFANTTSTIGQIAIRAAFSNSLIAAPIIGSVALGTINPSNNGNPFGVAGTSIKNVRGNDGQRINLTNAQLVTSPFSNGDLVLRLTT